MLSQSFFPIIIPSRCRAISRVEGVSRVEFEISGSKIFSVNVRDALVTFGCALRGYRACGYPNATGDIDSLTSMVRETGISSQHEHNVGIRPHGTAVSCFR